MDNISKDDFYLLMDKYLSGDLDEAQNQKLSSLLHSQPYAGWYKEYAIKFAKSNALSFELDKADNYETQILPFLVKEEKQRRTISRAYLLRITSIAASIVVAVFAGMYINNKYTQTQYADVETVLEVPLGSQMKTILPDGSEVWLNSGSRMCYNPNLFLSKREVSLLGEGYFDIQKDTKHPFKVHVGELKVEVLGTVFNIKAYPEAEVIDIGLISGSIAIDGKYLKQKEILRPDDRLLYNKQTHKYELLTKENTSRLASWTTSGISFVNSSLPDILKDVERKYNVRFIIESNALRNEYFTGSISLNLSLNELLEYLDVDRKYQWIQHGNVITIKDK